jgi:pimeloyl-ACP methyl ester carboxylesterase
VLFSLVRSDTGGAHRVDRREVALLDRFGPADRVTVPTAIAGFTRQFTFEGEPPCEWVERLYNVRCWTPMPRSGHFAPVEEPELLAGDIAAFFAETR